MQTPRSERGLRGLAGGFAGLVLVAGGALACGALAAAPPAPPNVPNPVDTANCPKLTSQPTEAELAAARTCAALGNLAAPPVPTGSGGTGTGGSSGSASGPGPGGPGGPGTPGNAPPQPGSTDGLQGPYAVRQTKSLGREAISGSVCDKSQPFEVHFATPPASFNTRFAPSAPNGQSGRWTYAYDIPRAGESHAAQGTYTLQADAAAHALHLTMTGSDHVAFKGFDGTMPIEYQFDLFATPGTPCIAPH